MPPWLSTVADDELVLGAPRALLWEGDGWRGIREEGAQEIVARALGAASFRRRGEAEHDPGWKQLIPYVVVRDGAAVFLMRRTRAGGDERLHERFTIGVGGHVNPGDLGIAGALLREWHEELATAFDPEVRLLGLLNDDGDSVGAVHLGLVYEADARGRPVTIRETDKLGGAFAGVDELWSAYDRMETWSQLLLEHLLPRAR